jgi:hypothetical protein
MLLFSLFQGSERCKFGKKKIRRQSSEDNSVQILDECDLNDLEDVLSESDDEFIPQGDASESECYQCTNH